MKFFILLLIIFSSVLYSCQDGFSLVSPKPEGGIEINSSAIARIVDIKGWTRGVPEEIACTVSQHYWQ